MAASDPHPVRQGQGLKNCNFTTIHHAIVFQAPHAYRSLTQAYRSPSIEPPCLLQRVMPSYSPYPCLFLCPCLLPRPCFLLFEVVSNKTVASKSNANLSLDVSCYVSTALFWRLRLRPIVCFFRSMVLIYHNFLHILSNAEGSSLRPGGEPLLTRLRATATGQPYTKMNCFATCWRHMLWNCSR